MKKKKAGSKSAFFNLRTLVALGCLLFGAVLTLFAAGVLPGPAALQPVGSAPDSAGSAASVRPVGVKAPVLFAKSVKNDVSPPLRDLPAIPMTLQARNCELKDNPPLNIPHKDAPDGALQELEAPTKLGLAQPNMPSPTLNFDGIGFPGVVCSCAPPDTDGAAGLNQYVQEVNEGLQVFNKSTGASEFGPVAVSSLWKGFGGVCETAGEGDVVVLYDHFANRWLVSQFAVQPAVGVPTDECVAISTSADATGSYYRYDFALTAFGVRYYDYPHIGIWSDGYYLSNNVFNSAGTAFQGPMPFAMDRSNMLQGNPATILAPTGSPLGSSVGDLLPADIDGMTLPPSGAPETFIGFPTAGNYTIYHFHADFGNPGMSTWTTFNTVAAAAFTQLCAGGRSCVPQPGVGIAGAANSATANGLDGIGDRFMFRAAYRNLGTQASPQESLVANYSVCATGVGSCTSGTGVGQSGIRWVEIQNVSNGPLAKNQEETYNNTDVGGGDNLWRWMGSIAMDHNGDMAMGFSTSAGTTGTAFPSIHYTGRLSTDPLNKMAQGEATLFSGLGSQSTTGNRWGDYSALSVDPEDDCTFWYTTEYYPAGPSSFNWRTRIGSFSFPQCTPQTTQSVAAVSVYNVADFTGINPGTTAGFTVTVNSSGTDTANGLSFSDPLPSASGINWSISSGGPEWSITGSPPNQALAFSTTTMAQGTSSTVHVQSATSSLACGSTTLSHTALLTSTNAGSGFASASTAIDCTNCTPNAFTDNSPQNPAPVALFDQAIASVGNNVYMFSGVQNGTAEATGAWVLSGNTYTALASVAAANGRNGAKAASDGSQFIYIIGGINSAATEQSTNIRYDTVGNTYATEATAPVATDQSGVAYFNGKIYYMGGYTNTGHTTSTNAVSIYNIGTNTWSSGATMPLGVAYPEVTYMNVGGTDYIYLAGGLTGPGVAQSTVYRYNISGNSWSTLPTPMPSTIWGAFNGMVNGYWVVAGGITGSSGGGVDKSVYSYLPSTDTWYQNASLMPGARYRGNGGAVTPGKLFAIGGRDPSLVAQSDTQVYTPSLCAPGLVSVVSNMTHGTTCGAPATTYGLPISTSAPTGTYPFGMTIEPRNPAFGTGAGNYTIVFNFAVPVNSSGTPSATNASAATPTFSGNSMTVGLTSVNAPATVTLSVPNVSGPGYGNVSPSVNVGFLIGDVNGNGYVNIGDTIVQRSNDGATLGLSNFMYDVNLDGCIGSGDTIVIRNSSGTCLPGCP